MEVRFSRRRCAMLLGGVGLSSALSGCSSMFSRKPETVTAAMPVQSTPDPIRIIYRTRTDRLNLAGAKLPHCSIADLRVNYPHPLVKAEMCSATLRVTPCSVDATPFPQRGVTASVASMFDGDTVTGSTSPTLTISADVALWEVQAIVTSLEKLNFFHKHRTVLSADVFLSVETAKYAVGKKYRPVAELDAILLRVSQSQVEAVAASYPQTARAELTRLPAF